MADTLFSFDDEQVVNNGPVTCLGIEFENDDKRREYFREELRKKLPELRLIEGFPIGTDDDIIALSDPPYYTACPNPWINDFIKEWEAEKSRLITDGKRKSSLEVKEPYASDISEGKNNKIYNAHSYHTKVPHPAIMRYILHYTQPGDIIYDGFAGTGMTGVAAQMCGRPESEVRQTIEREWKDAKLPTPNWGYRKSICGDLSPVASFIAYNYNVPVNVNEFKRQVTQYLNEVEQECGWMYMTRNSRGVPCRINYVIWSDVFECPSCGSEIVFYDSAVDLENKQILDSFPCPHCGARYTKNDVSKAKITKYDEAIDQTIVTGKSVPVLIEYTDVDGKRKEKKPDEYDYELVERIEKEPIENWFPTDLMMGIGDKWGDTWRAGYHFGINRVHHFYTKRALAAYAAMRKRFSRQQLWILTSILEGGSKLNRERPFGLPSKLSGTLYVASTIREIDVISFAKRKVNRYVDAWFDRLAGHALVGICSATSAPIKSDSIDYIFTDPPFGANIMYSELNFIQESWLKVKTNNKQEAIVNDNQNKDIFDYQRLMTASLKEYYRVLKPGKWMTVEFSNTSASVWNSIQNALQGVGFVVVNVAALDKKQGSFKAVTSPTAVKQDLIITCYKPTEQLSEKFRVSSNTSQNIWDFIEDLLEHLPIHLRRDNATTAVVERSAKILFDRLIAYYVQHGYQVPIDAADFQKGLKERFVERDEMFFTAEQAIEYEEKKKETTSFVSLALLVGSEAEGIEWLKRKLENGPKTYSDILPDWMQDLVKPKKGDTLPELMQILDENFLKDENGYWHIPDLNDQAQLDAVKNKRLLKEFDVYVEAKKVKNARLEALRAGFKECYKNKDFATIVAVGDKIEEELLTTDEVLLRFYDIASSRV